MWKQLAPVVLVAACGASFRVPAELAGDVPVVIHSQISEDLCSFSITPAGSPAPSYWAFTDANGGNRTLSPGQSSKIGIKRGAYRVDAITCGGMYNTWLELRIDGPTELSLVDAARPSTHDGESTHVFFALDKRQTGGPTCVSAGDCDPGDPQACCPNYQCRATNHSTTSQYTCEP
jgi:hypothetical protein